MEQIQYTSIDRIISKVIRDLGVDNVNEGDLVEWTAEALEAIGAVTMYEEAVAFIEVKNHQCELPVGLHSIIQVARNYCFSDYGREDPFCPQKVVESVEERHINPCSCEAKNCENCSRIDYVLLDCEGKPITGYDVAYYRPYFDLQYEYNLWCSNNFYRGCYTPVRLTNHTFFNTIVCEERNMVYCNYHDAQDEYTVIQGKLLRFSFQDGSIALSYLRQVVDEETGYPMIPDHFSYTTAITKYITLRIMEREFYANREGAAQRMQKAESDWHWYCKQAGNHAMMPKGIDQWQNIMEQRQYMLPRTRNYYSFFGKMSRPEQRKWNDPDGRSNFRGYYLGN